MHAAPHIPTLIKINLRHIERRRQATFCKKFVLSIRYSILVIHQFSHSKHEVQPHTSTRSGSHAGVVRSPRLPLSQLRPATTTTSVVLPAGTVIGTVGDDGVEYFRGIPFAQAPTGSRRLKPPVRLERFDSGSVQATGVGPACPQMTALDFTPLLPVLGLPGVEETLLFGSTLGDEQEDCLTISVMRPKGTRAAADAKLPVLFWIYWWRLRRGQPTNVQRVGADS